MHPFSRLPLTHHLIGWFAIAFSSEIQHANEKKGILCDESYSLSRTVDGRLLFNGKSEHVIEQNGVIFVWRHPQSLAPTWYIPMLDDKKWSPFLYHQLSARTHPQEIYENSIDVAHFSVVHQFHDLIVEQDPIFDAHMMSVRHLIRRKNPSFLRNKLITADFEVRLHGIGCAFNHIHVPAFKMQVRMFALATPTQVGWVEIRLGVAIAMMNSNPIKNFFKPIIHRIIQKNIVKDFSQDVPIWENKCYRKKPLLVKGDGHIMKFRHWCQQFYA